MKSLPSAYGIIAWAFLAVPVTANASPESPEFYEDVVPFLKSNCIVCHNKTTAKARLNMETPELMIKGGDSGPALIPGKSAESLVVTASLHAEDLEMPPANNKSGAENLSQEQIAVLKRWIDQGAKAAEPKENTRVAWKALAAGTHPIYSVAVTRDGRFAACGRSNRIFLYDLASRQQVGEIGDPEEPGGTAHRAMVQSLAFSQDGSRLASGSFREVKIWKVEPQEPSSASVEPPQPADEALINKLKDSAKSEILSHALSPDGKLVIAGCSDGPVRVWETASLALVGELRGSLATAREIAQEEWMVARQSLEEAFQKTEVTRIETQDKALDELLKKAQEAIVAMQKVLPEKQKAVPPAKEEKAAQEKVVEEIRAQLAQVPKEKPDAALEKQLRDALEKLAPLAMKETSALAAVSAAESNIQDAEAEVKRIAASKAKNAEALAAVKASIEEAVKLRERAAAGLASAKQTLASSGAKPIAVALSPDGWRAAALFEDGRLTGWAVASGVPVAEAQGEPLSSPRLAFAADGGVTASGADGKKLATPGKPCWKRERTLGGENDPTRFADRINALAFSPDGKLLATGGGEPSRSGDVILYDVAAQKFTATWKELHDDVVMSLDFSPDGTKLATGAADKLARVVEVASGKKLNLLEGHTHYVMGVAFRADGRVLATAGADGAVVSWNMILGELKKKIEGWSKEVTSLQFIGATNQIVTSAGDNRIRIVSDDGAQIRDIAGLPDFMQSAASTANGGLLIGGGEDSMLRLWNGSDGKELAAFAAP